MAETESLRGQHQTELEELQFQQQEQVDTDTRPGDQTRKYV